MSEKLQLTQHVFFVVVKTEGAAMLSIVLNLSGHNMDWDGQSFDYQMYLSAERNEHKAIS